jgi:hypothetical protein
MFTILMHGTSIKSGFMGEKESVPAKIKRQYLSGELD